VVAPRAAHGGDVAFRPVTSPGQVCWDGDNPLHPPKAVAQPQTDPLATIARDGGGFRVVPAGPPRPRVLLLVRSCDATALAYVARLQAADLPDPAFRARADATAVVTLACTRPCPLGFCVCSDAGPFLRAGFDVQLTDLGTRYLAEVGSERGAALVALAAERFRPAEPADVARRCELEEAARRSFGDETCHFASAMRRVSTGRVAAELWEDVARRCLECGACTLLCPACTCFSVKDQRRDGHWVRCRTWDSCQYAAFTLEASGHNPRERQRERVKRRFFHKVSAQYFRRDGAVGCVGCGRCVQACFGATDMPAVVAAIRKGAWHG
jgi:ferredoxin